MKNTSDKALTSFFINLILILLGFISAVYLGIFLNNRQAIEQEMHNRARSIVETVIFARNWNARHGSVYVEKKPGTVSNPYLAKPDIQTDDGTVYTMKNPSLMVREISEIASREGTFQFHLASLKPLNPINRPDSFERQALVAFEKGVKEMSVKERQDNSTHFRYMVPLMVEESCLECHARQGYQVGDVRGSLAVRFNIDAIESTYRKTLMVIIGLALVSFASLAAIIYRLVHRLNERLKVAEEKLRHLAITDELTGLRNRRYLLERLHAELTEMRRTTKPLACILFDLDHFKRVNDTFGHEAGDEALRMVANVVREQCRENDILGRFGGEEFAIVLPETTLEGAHDIAERLRESIQSCQVSPVSGKTLTVTASFGVACIVRLPMNVDAAVTELLKQADVALYRAKEFGRDRVEIYS